MGRERKLKIEVGKYAINSDQWCMWISEKVKSEETGRPRMRRITGYRTNFDKLKEDFVKVRMSEDKETLTELIDVLRQTEKDLIMLNEAALENDFTDLKTIAKKIGE